jgi:HK97 family phage portal protein
VGWLDRALNLGALDARYSAAPVKPGPASSSRSPGVNAFTINDLMSAPEFEGFLQGGNSTGGVTVNWRTALCNPTVYRCVTLISNVIGALPFQLLRKGHNSGEALQARDHPLYDVLARRPNNWQTAFEFRRLMQHRVLTRGNAFALPIESRGRISELIPLDPGRMRIEQKTDWAVEYIYQKAAGGEVRYPSEKMFHVMGPSEDGLRGLALVEVANEALGLALAAQRAAARMFAKGIAAGGAIKFPAGKTLTPEAMANFRASIESIYTGAENAGSWMILEDGLDAAPFTTNSKDAQNVETRRYQSEEVCRIFGVPRPFVMLDDTSWGSGIEQLGMFLVQYGLNPNFVSWEQAVDRTMLTDIDRRNGVYAKFNERALMRGLIKDQGEFFAKALGTGGGLAWMTQDEVRELSELKQRGGEADTLSMGMTASAGGAVL